MSDAYRGRVLYVDQASFTVEIIVDDRPLHVDIKLHHLPDVEAGDIVDVEPDRVTRVDLGTWTEEDIAEIRRRAAERHESFVRGNPRLAELLSDPTIAAEVSRVEEEIKQNDEEGK